MGECLISRRGGEAYKLPVLDGSYPKDVNTAMSSGGTVSFSVSITEHGKPAEYTYQWYKNGQAVSGANGIQYIASSTSASTFTVYCEVTNKGGTVTSRVATATIYNAMPTSDCWSGGQATLITENNYDWNIVCTSSLTLTLPRDTKVDVFLCGGGGGGGGSRDNAGGGGGGGGYTTTAKNISATGGHPYTIVVGSGGSGGGSEGNGSAGGTSSAFSKTATGGGGGKTSSDNVWGGGGGGGTGAGGGGGGKTAGGGPGGDGALPFGTSYGSSYLSWKYGAGGGGGSGSGSGAFSGGVTGGGRGGHKDDAGIAGTANSGGGGGGGGRSYYNGSSGGSGVVIIRNAR